MRVNHTLHGAGLGLRRPLLGPLTEAHPAPIDFLEIAPENWIGVGGSYGKQLRFFTERYPFVAHGLSLSLGGPAPLDWTFLAQVKDFLATHQVSLYSEHLSFCHDGGHLYDLMPIPFTDEAVRYVADRIRQVQDFLGQRIAIENISYYAAPLSEFSEAEFINAVLAEADCALLLDVNNSYVNGVNHGYDPLAFLAAMPAERLAYLHVAGHYQESDDLIIDTHGATVVDPVWALLQTTYAHFGVVPTLLERDFNLPPLHELLDEVATIRDYQQTAGQEARHAVAQR